MSRHSASVCRLQQGCSFSLCAGDPDALPAKFRMGECTHLSGFSNPLLEAVGSALCQVRPDVRLSVQPLRRSSLQSCFRELRIAASLVAKETWGTWWMRHILGKGSLPSSLVHGSAFRQGSGYTPGMLQQFIPQVTREPAPLGAHRMRKTGSCVQKALWISHRLSHSSTAGCTLSTWSALHSCLPV